MLRNRIYMHKICPPFQKKYYQCEYRFATADSDTDMVCVTVWRLSALRLRLSKEASFSTCCS